MANPAAATAEHAKGSEAGTHRLRCLIVTPEKTWLDQHVETVVLPLFDGELGVLPGRSPLIGRLGFGELRTTDHGVISRYFVEGGFAQVKDNVVTILTNRAIPADQLDAATASQELNLARSTKATTDIDSAEKSKSVAKARAKVRLANQRR